MSGSSEEERGKPPVSTGPCSQQQDDLFRSPADDRRDFPKKGRLLGLDYGTKRIGVAVSTSEQTIASPLDNYTRHGEQQDVRYLTGLIEQNGIEGVVVGLPVHLSGDEGGKAREARKFGAWVGRVTGLPIQFWDERYTTALAEEHLLAAELSKKKRKARLDKLAAQIMLQSYLDTADKNRPPEEI